MADSQQLTPLAKEVYSVLEREFPESSLEIEDQSFMHAGHAGAREHGGGHLVVKLISKDFEGLSRLERHRKVYQALEKELSENRIHALRLMLSSPKVSVEKPLV